MAISYGASALGLVSEMPSGPGVISERTIAEIASTIPPSVSSFLLTSQCDAYKIISQQKRCRVNTIQLCDSVQLEAYKQLRESLPGISIVQVIHITGEEAKEEAFKVAPFVDALLLDSGNPSLAVKQLGGTGKVHNWEISRQIGENIDVPIFLAGGLNAKNISKAISIVKPFGVDVCNGLRKDGHLDEGRLSDFFRQIFTFTENKQADFVVKYRITD